MQTLVYQIVLEWKIFADKMGILFFDEQLKTASIAQLIWFFNVRELGWELLHSVVIYSNALNIYIIVFFLDKTKLC